MNELKGVRVEYHILQSFPVSCLNRDETGSPKTVRIGGASRGRVSSQCWKRVVRERLRDFGVELGVRTKHATDMVRQCCEDLGASWEKALECAEEVIDSLTKKTKGKDDTLVFFSWDEAKVIAEFAKERDFDVSKIVEKKEKKKGENSANADKKDTKTGTICPELMKRITLVFDPHRFDPDPEKPDKKAKPIPKELLEINARKDLSGLDIALFGRMMANAPDLSIDAAASFSHAITTHEISNEVDFFAALDDCQVEPKLKESAEDHAGSAHIGSLYYNAGTFYRYIGLDLGQLTETLGAENVSEAVTVFTKALYDAVPSARQTTMASARPWDYAKILVRKGQPMMAMYDKPIRSRSGFLDSSIEFLEGELDKNETLSGSLYGKIGELCFKREGKELVSIDEIAEGLTKLVADLSKKVML